MTLDVRATARGASVPVEVKVRASRTRVLGVTGERLSVALAAPPVDGAANDALRDALADYFDLARGAVRILSGEKHKKKLVELGGMTPEAVLARLSAQ